MSIHEKAKTKEFANGIQVKEIQNCARCGGHHNDVFFKRFTNTPEPDKEGLVFTYWAMCPKLNEPIIMAHVKDSQQ